MWKKAVLIFFLGNGKIVCKVFIKRGHLYSKYNSKKVNLLFRFTKDISETCKL